MEKLNAKDSELTQMKAKIENAELVKKLAISEVTNKYEKERDKIFIFFRLRGGRQAATLPRVGGLKVSEIKREDALR